MRMEPAAARRELDHSTAAPFTPSMVGSVFTSDLNPRSSYVEASQPQATAPIPAPLPLQPAAAKKVTTVRVSGLSAELSPSEVIAEFSRVGPCRLEGVQPAQDEQSSWRADFSYSDRRVALWTVQLLNGSSLAGSTLQVHLLPEGEGSQPALLAPTPAPLPLPVPALGPTVLAVQPPLHVVPSSMASSDGSGIAAPPPAAMPVPSSTQRWGDEEGGMDSSVVLSLAPPADSLSAPAAAVHPPLPPPAPAAPAAPASEAPLPSGGLAVAPRPPLLPPHQQQSQQLQQLQLQQQLEQQLQQQMQQQQQVQQQQMLPPQQQPPQQQQYSYKTVLTPTMGPNNTMVYQQQVVMVPAAPQQQQFQLQQEHHQLQLQRQQQMQQQLALQQHMQQQQRQELVMIGGQLYYAPAAAPGGFSLAQPQLMQQQQQQQGMHGYPPAYSMGHLRHGAARAAAPAPKPPQPPKPTEPEFVVHPDALADGREKRTTIMIRNIPNKYTQFAVLDELCDFRGSFDFLYVPINARRGCNIGYAFANFVSPAAALAFHTVFKSRQWSRATAPKLSRLAFARLQGRDTLVAHFQSTLVGSHVKPEYRPLLFCVEGPQKGHMEVFPLPDDNESLGSHFFASLEQQRQQEQVQEQEQEARDQELRQLHQQQWQLQLQPEHPRGLGAISPPSASAAATTCTSAPAPPSVAYHGEVMTAALSAAFANTSSLASLAGIPPGFGVEPAAAPAGNATDAAAVSTSAAAAVGGGASGSPGSVGEAYSAELAAALAAWQL